MSYRNSIVSLLVIIAFCWLNAALTLAQSKDSAAQQKSASAPTKSQQEAPLKEKLQPEPSEQLQPAVTIRTEKNGDQVQEYRVSGKITMIKITPERGPPYYLYDDNGDGRLDRDDAPAGIAQVYWTIYQWD